MHQMHHTFHYVNTLNIYERIVTHHIAMDRGSGIPRLLTANKYNFYSQRT